MVRGPDHTAARGKEQLYAVADLRPAPVAKTSRKTCHDFASMFSSQMGRGGLSQRPLGIVQPHARLGRRLQPHAGSQVPQGCLRPILLVPRTASVGFLSASWVGFPSSRVRFRCKGCVEICAPFGDIHLMRRWRYVQGFTALQMATCSGHRSAAAALLAAGASLHLNTTTTVSDTLENEAPLEVPWVAMTPLHIAAHRGDAHMAWILLHAQTGEGPSAVGAGGGCRCVL